MLSATSTHEHLCEESVRAAEEAAGEAFAEFKAAIDGFVNLAKRQHDIEQTRREEWLDGYRALRADVDAKMAIITSDLEAKFEQCLAAKDAYTASDLYTEVMKKVDGICAEQQRAIDFLQNEIQVADKYLEEKADDHKQDMTKLVQRFCLEKTKLEKSLNHHLQTLQAALDKDYTRCRAAIQMEITKVQKQLDTIEEDRMARRNELQTNYNKHVSQLQTEHNDKMQAIRSTHNDRTLALREKILDLQSTLPVEKLKLQSTIIELQRQYDLLQAELKRTTPLKNIGSGRMDLKIQEPMITGNQSSSVQELQRMQQVNEDLKTKIRNLQLSEHRKFRDIERLLRPELNEKIDYIKLLDQQISAFLGIATKTNSRSTSAETLSMSTNRSTAVESTTCSRIRTAVVDPIDIYEPASYNMWPLALEVVQRFNVSLERKIDLQNELDNYRSLT